MIIAKKNAAYYLSFAAIDSTTPSSYKSGVSPIDTAYYKDGAGSWTPLSLADTATEIGSTGIYEIDLSASELNHDSVVIKFSASGMADDGYQFDLQDKLVDDLNDFNAASDDVAVVTLVTTTTTNSDMRGTDSAATATALGVVDGNIDAIKLKTDKLAFTVTNQVDSNAKSMNDTAITGAGTEGDPWT